MIDKLFGGHYPLLKQALHASALRQEVIAHNIANVNTPDYRRKEVRFEELLRSAQGTQALRATHPQHLPYPPYALANPQVVPDEDAPMRPDGNTIDIDYEMAQLAHNQIRFQALSQLISGRYQSLKTVITGGGR